MSDRERPQPPDLRRQVAFIGNDRDTPWSGGIPTAVSVVLVRDGVWRAVAEIGCSHPGIMWSGPPREEWKQAQTDREDYLTAQTVENGHLLDGTPAGMFPGGKKSRTRRSMPCLKCGLRCRRRGSSTNRRLRRRNPNRRNGGCLRCSRPVIWERKASATAILVRSNGPVRSASTRSATQ